MYFYLNLLVVCETDLFHQTSVLKNGFLVGKAWLSAELNHVQVYLIIRVHFYSAISNKLVKVRYSYKVTVVDPALNRNAQSEQKYVATVFRSVFLSQRSYFCFHSCTSCYCTM